MKNAKYIVIAIVPFTMFIMAFTFEYKLADTGKEVFTANKCGTCHSIEAQGITKKGKGPDLSNAGLKDNADWIAKYLKKEEKKNGKAHAVAFKGSESDLKTLSTWLASQKSEKKTDAKSQSKVESDTKNTQVSTTTDTGKAQAHVKSDNEIKNAMVKMHKQMTGTKISGNADRDFAHLMIHHHEGAVEISQHEVNNGQNEQLKQLAIETIEKQQSEIQQLKEFDDLKRISDVSKSPTDMGKDVAGHHDDMDMTDSVKAGEREVTGETDMARTTETDENQLTGATKKANEVLDDVNKMMEEVDDMELTGNTDQDYVSILIKHHQSGIDMAESYLSEIQNARLKSIAQKIMDENKEEITKLEKLQENLK